MNIEEMKKKFKDGMEVKILTFGQYVAHGGDVESVAYVRRLSDVMLACELGLISRLERALYEERMDKIIREGRR